MYCICLNWYTLHMPRVCMQQLSDLMKSHLKILDNMDILHVKWMWLFPCWVPRPIMLHPDSLVWSPRYCHSHLLIKGDFNARKKSNVLEICLLIFSEWIYLHFLSFISSDKLGRLCRDLKWFVDWEFLLFSCRLYIKFASFYRLKEILVLNSWHSLFH